MLSNPSLEPSPAPAKIIEYTQQNESEVNFTNASLTCPDFENLEEQTLKNTTEMIEEFSSPNTPGANTGSKFKESSSKTLPLSRPGE